MTEEQLKAYRALLEGEVEFYKKQYLDEKNEKNKKILLATITSYIHALHMLDDVMGQKKFTVY